MLLEEFLVKEKNNLLRRWFQLITDTYPPQTARLLKKESNEFANPVGSSIQAGIEGLYEQFLKEIDPEETCRFLDRIIRVRAIQDFTPSQAVAFVYLFKRVVREAVDGLSGENRISYEELLTFGGKVDEMALLAFNIYTECRERLHEVRVTEIKNRTHRLLQRANLLEEIPEPKSRS